MRSTEGETNGPSLAIDGSVTGRFVIFESSACDLLDAACASDSNGVRDVFLLDRDADGDWTFDGVGDHVITRVSEGAVEANGASRARSTRPRAAKTLRGGPDR